MRKIRIGTRPSPLALKQVEEIAERLPGLRFDIVRIATEGDRDKSTPLSGREDSRFFTSDVEEALLTGSIDAAVHSAKDLEAAQPKGLAIAAMTRSTSPFECLASKNGLRLSELAPGAIVGTSSQKRKEAVMRFREDLAIRNIRGNVDDRIRQLDRGDFDAIVAAHAALIRLGYEERISEIISPDVITPHPLQGRLALQVRRDRYDLIKVFRGIHET
jgi:hydroxymethylbilane synthase